MKEKKHTLTQSQRIGIVWLSVALVAIAILAVFSSRKPQATVPNDTATPPVEHILKQQEESAYADRYKEKKNSKIVHRADSVPRLQYSHQPPPPVRQPLVVELNTADTLTLQLLHGIGPAFARRIVAYRERVGGFVDKRQLLEVYGFTPSLLDHISPSLRVDTTAVKKIKINTVGLKELVRHPYIEYYQARDIVRLRQQGVGFVHADDLRAVPSMADSTLVRLLPYLDFTLEATE